MVKIRVIGTRSETSQETEVCTVAARVGSMGFDIPKSSVVGDQALYLCSDGTKSHLVWDVFSRSYPEIHADNRMLDYLPVKSAFDTQEGGSHYSSKPDGYQPFQISKALDLNPVEHTVLKYLLRHRGKNGKVDLLKAKHCLDILIEQEYPDALAP